MCSILSLACMNIIYFGFLFMTEIKKDSLIKIRCCAVMQYFDYYDVSEIAVIESRIKSLTNIKKYAIVIHDKDLLDS